MDTQLFNYETFRGGWAAPSSNLELDMERFFMNEAQ
jgi:hypothetical protein